ncbi:MAG: AraC family transcriptional regulator ligand-binding domain-containing protein [Gammaproteobacteria bacterium]|nr:AraC family transcriptional regulator ligand-binding domain-containing protein [Gammaproteobacteria bacterium]
MKLEGLPGAWILETFQRGGVNLNELIQQHPDEVETALYRPDTISPDCVNQLLISCAKISGNQNFGLTMNKLVDISMYGLFGYILLQTSTVKDFFNNLERYYPTFYSGASFKIITRKETIIIQYATEQLPKVCPRHDNEWSLGFVVDYLKFHLGDIARPISVSFTHQSPDDLSEIESLFGQNLQFSQTKNQIVYKKPFINKKISNSDPWMLNILRQQAEKMLQEYYKENSLEKEVRLLLLEKIENGQANASDIARTLGFSLSTFKRRLAQENSEFSIIKLSVKNQLAQEMLSGSKTSIVNIGKKIGFNDQSSFTRFFIRCNQISPLEYRKKHTHKIT